MLMFHASGMENTVLCAICSAGSWSCFAYSRDTNVAFIWFLHISLQLNDQCSCLSPHVSSDIFPSNKTSRIQNFLPNLSFICVVIRRINTHTHKRRHVLETEWGMAIGSHSFRLQQKFQECYHLPVCMQTMKNEEDGGLIGFDGKLDCTVTASKTECLQNEIKHTDQPNRADCPHNQLLSIARTKNHDGERTVPLVSGTEKTGYTHLHMKVETRKASRERWNLNLNWYSKMD